jgi:hypothetical protein
VATWTPDPTFYTSPRLAARAPAERLAYVASFDPERKRPDALAVVDLDPASLSYAHIVGQVEMPRTDDELHHLVDRRRGRFLARSRIGNDASLIAKGTRDRITRKAR